MQTQPTRGYTVCSKCYNLNPSNASIKLSDAADKNKDSEKKVHGILSLRDVDSTFKFFYLRIT